MFDQKSFENKNFSNQVDTFQLQNTELGKSKLKFGLGNVEKKETSDKLFGAMLRMPLMSDGVNIRIGIP